MKTLATQARAVGYPTATLADHGSQVPHHKLLRKICGVHPTGRPSAQTIGNQKSWTINGPNDTSRKVVPRVGWSTDHLNAQLWLMMPVHVSSHEKISDKNRDQLYQNTMKQSYPICTSMAGLYNSQSPCQLLGVLLQSRIRWGANPL